MLQLTGQNDKMGKIKGGIILQQISCTIEQNKIKRNISDKITIE